MEQTKYDVFISYSRKDYVVAHKIKNILERNGLKMFVDVNDLTMGMGLAETITTTIQRCRAVFAVLSESSVNSQWWRIEIELAQKLNLPIVFIADDFKYRETLPYNIRQNTIVEYVFFINHAEDVIKNVFPNSTIDHDYKHLPTVDVLSCPSYRGKKNNTCGRPKTKPPTASSWPLIRRRPWLFVIIVFIVTIVLWIIVGTVIHKNNTLAKSPAEDTLAYSSEYEKKCREYQCLERKDDIDRIQEEIENLKRKRTIIIAHNDYLSGNEKERELTEITMAIMEKEETCDSLRREYAQYYSKDTLNIEDRNSKQNKDVDYHQSEKIVQSSLIVVIVILSCLSVILVILLTLSRKHANRLKTRSTIVSDSKAKAKIGAQNVILEKGNASNVILPYGEQQMELNYMDFNEFKHINCFIGGSTQLQTERDALRATISVVYNKWKEKRFQILSFTYEDFDRKFVAEGQQHLYDVFIENDANLAIFVIKGDVGDKTVREFDKAYESFKKRQKPSIIVYRDINCSLGKTAEVLKSKVELAQQYWIDYGTLNELKYHFQDILSSDLWSIYMDEFRTAR